MLCIASPHLPLDCHRSQSHPIHPMARSPPLSSDQASSSSSSLKKPQTISAYLKYFSCIIFVHPTTSTPNVQHLELSPILLNRALLWNIVIFQYPPKKSHAGSLGGSLNRIVRIAFVNEFAK